MEKQIQQQNTTSPTSNSCARILLGMDLFETARTKKALDLLDLLNMDRKPNEMYHPQWYFQHGNYFVLMVANKEKECLFNVIDFYGEMPEGTSVCWRCFEHIKREINIS